MKRLLILISVCMLVIGIGSSALAYYVEFGDAAGQEVADVVLDIVFVMDTSASMQDEILTISNNLQSFIDNFECPECDAWVRARLLAITDTYGIFDENVTGYVTGAGGTPVTNQLEDNGPAVTDMVNWYTWNDDTTAAQDYYKAVVTIGDEGTQDGYPSNQADYDAAFVANQAAAADDIMIFSLIGTAWPSYIANEAHRNDVFTVMAEGGFGTYDGVMRTFSNTGGLAIFTTNDTLEEDIENIICTASGGGTQQVPEPATTLLLGLGLLGLAALKRRRKK